MQTECQCATDRVRWHTGRVVAGCGQHCPAGQNILVSSYDEPCCPLVILRAGAITRVSPGTLTNTKETLLTTVFPCSAVLFDCDGVLVDSESVIHRSWTRWAHHFQIDPPLVLAAVHGRRSQDTVAQFIAAAGQEEALAIIDAIELDDASAVTAIPGAVDLLASIPRERWAIVTSGSRALAGARMAAASIPVPQVLVSGQDVRHGKPHPEGYLAAARLLGVAPEHCVVVEDAPAGIRAAREAGVGYVLGVGRFDTTEDRPDVATPDLRNVRWRGDGLEVG
jgi:sugar-phosphatase